MTWRVVSLSRSARGLDIDIVYDNYVLLLQTNLELWLGILAANIPTLAPILDGKPFLRFVEYISLKSPSSSWRSTPHVPLRTWGRGENTRRPANTSFEVIQDDSKIPFRGQIMKNQSFEVSSQHPSDSYDSHGHSADIVWDRNMYAVTSCAIEKLCGGLIQTSRLLK